MESKKYGTNELIYKTEIDSKTENKLMVTKGERGGGGINWEYGINRYTPLCMGFSSGSVVKKHQGPTYSTGSHAQHLVKTCNGK